MRRQVLGSVRDGPDLKGPGAPAGAGKYPRWTRPERSGCADRCWEVSAMDPTRKVQVRRQVLGSICVGPDLKGLGAGRSQEVYTFRHDLEGQCVPTRVSGLQFSGTIWKVSVCLQQAESRHAPARPARPSSAGKFARTGKSWKVCAGQRGRSHTMPVARLDGSPPPSSYC